jgi:hypothetical protein
MSYGQIVGIVHWREKECNVDFRIRASSARSLMTTLLGFCGYCTYVSGICGITSLRQVLTREIIRSFTTWLHDVRGCRWYTVYSMLDRLYHLTQLGHPLFAGSNEEYAWFRTLLSGADTPIDVQQKLLRHAQISTTQEYGGPPMENQRRANSKVVRKLLFRESAG